ncbi:MAG: hypothetical protein BroJett030_18830 [Alphaproteobacteria bacterium]|nr:MAG: hypothetical protein BroJett030_18830 [Alphaproteobacteria bacterium]
MADYYSILKKTISGLPANTPENRKVVYGKARQAIDRQLRSLDPPPTNDAIARQMQMLEQAIVRMEAEFRGVTPPPAAAAAPPPASTRPAQPPERHAGVGLSPRPASQPAPPAGVGLSPRPGGLSPAPPRSAAPATPTHGRPLATPAPSAPATQPRAQAARPMPDTAPANAGRPLAGSAPPPWRDDLTVADQRPPAAQRGAPAQRPLAGSTAIPGLDDDDLAPAYDDSLDALDDVDDVIAAPEHRSPRPAPRRSGRALSLIVTLAVVALVGVGGYALWRNKEPLMAALGLDGGRPGEPVVAEQPQQPQEPEQPATTTETPPEAEPGDDAGKEDVRLSQSGETVPGPDRVAPQAPAVREAGEPALPSTTPLPEGPAAQVSPVEEPGEPGQAETGSEATPGETETAAEPQALPAIAQKAFLYEEGGTGAGATRDNAAVVWALEQEAPAEGMAPEAVIHGSFDVPGRGLAMHIFIRRNVDEALPASHIIELVFEAPPDFSGGNIDNVARFVMKSSEQARGEGLIAVPAKIDDGNFLIALNNLSQAIETNRRLLIESTWIDIPVGYTSGKRALVTLEKGAQGDKVFRDAFVDWDGR